MALTEEQLEKLREGIGEGDVVSRGMQTRGERKYPGIKRKPVPRTSVQVPERETDALEVEPIPARLPKFAGQPEEITPKADIAQPLPGKPMAASPYEITDSTLTPEARARFERQPTAPGTRMRSGPGYGGRPEGGWSPDYGRRSTMASGIAPPKSIGDIQRYQREVGEQERGFAQGMELRQAGIEERRAGAVGRESAVRTDIAQEESAVKRAATEAKTLSSTQKQGRIDTLMKEYDNPETTPKRRAMIERQTAMLSGRALPKTPKTERDKGITMKVVDPETSEESEKLVNPYTGEDIVPKGSEESGVEQPTAMAPVADRVEGKTTHKIGDINFVWNGSGWVPQ